LHAYLNCRLSPSRYRRTRAELTTSTDHLWGGRPVLALGRTLVQEHITQGKQIRWVARMLFPADHGRARLGFMPDDIILIGIGLRIRAEGGSEVRELGDWCSETWTRKRRRDGGGRERRGIDGDLGYGEVREFASIISGTECKRDDAAPVVLMNYYASARYSVALRCPPNRFRCGELVE
jgi:hypothetical protein